MAIDGIKTQAKTTTVSRTVSPILVVKKRLLLKLRSASLLAAPLMARNELNPISTIGRVKYGQQTHADAIRKIPIASLVFIAHASSCGIQGLRFLVLERSGKTQGAPVAEE